MQVCFFMLIYKNEIYKLAKQQQQNQTTIKCGKQRKYETPKKLQNTFLELINEVGKSWEQG